MQICRNAFEDYTGIYTFIQTKGLNQTVKDRGILITAFETGCYFMCLNLMGSLFAATVCDMFLAFGYFFP